MQEKKYVVFDLEGENNFILEDSFVIGIPSFTTI